MSWTLTRIEGDNFHIRPDDDLVDHTLTDDCTCHPGLEAVFHDDGSNHWLYSHHSLDGREHHEPDHQQDSCPLCGRQAPGHDCPGR